MIIIRDNRFGVCEIIRPSATDCLKRGSTVKSQFPMSAEHGGHGGGAEGNFVVVGATEASADFWNFLFDFIPSLLFGWLDAVT